MNFSSPHQILGIIVYLLLLAQWFLGFFHHRVYKKTQQPTWMIKPHKFGLGGLVVGLGVANCALGFRFALDGHYNRIFVPVVIGLCLLLIASLVVRHFLAKRKARRGGAGGVFGGPAPPYQASDPRAPPSYQAPHGTAVPPAGGYYGNPSAGSSNVGLGRGDVELNKMGPPPSYNGEPQRPRELV